MKDICEATGLSRIGAPACVAGLEEVIAMGAKKIIMFGCCGVLNDTAVQNKIIVLVSAVRDKGTSCRPLPASEEIYADEKSKGLGIFPSQSLYHLWHFFKAIPPEVPRRS